jgi:hypothetical protein
MLSAVLPKLAVRADIQGRQLSVKGRRTRRSKRPERSNYCRHLIPFGAIGRRARPLTSLCIADATPSTHIRRRNDGSLETEVEMRKTLVAAAAFLFVAAAPAFAQSYNPSGTGNITQWFDYGNHLHPNPSPNAATPYSAYGEVPTDRPRAHVRSKRHTRMLHRR